MRKITERHKLFTRRAIILGGVKGVTFTALGARLYYLQFVQSDTYRTLAEDNRINLQLIAPARGRILDRNRKLLAENNLQYQVLLKKEDPVTTAKHLKRICRLLKITLPTQQKLEQEMKRQWKGHSFKIKDHLSWDELARLQFYSAEMPGMIIETGQLRTYPLTDRASHLLGYVGGVSQAELDPDEPVLKLPGFKIGKNGVEKSFEEELRGKPGLRHLEMNANGLMVREVERKEPDNGVDLTLTIDRKLQGYCAERLGEESGAICVMKVNTGEVLALVSMPSFDPNRFSEGISQVYWDELRGNEKNPLLNKAISGQYPPGSTFKMVVGLAALEKGMIQGGNSVFCPGHFYLGNHRFNCWKPGGHGSMNVNTALQESCDTFFYTMAYRMGIDPIAEMSRKLGLGERTGIEIPGEKTGIVPDAAWKRKSYNMPWMAGDTVNVGIGQGYVLTTPLQLCVMTSRLVNGGMAVLPRLNTAHLDAKPASLGFTPEHLTRIMDGMFSVVNKPGGTALGSKLPDPNLTMGGKTGTSQVRRITQRGVDQNTIPWLQRHHALFVGYAPAELPEYAVSVIVEHGGGGASAAAPVARDVVMKIFELYPVKGEPA